MCAHEEAAAARNSCLSWQGSQASGPPKRLGAPLKPRHKGPLSVHKKFWGGLGYMWVSFPTGNFLIEGSALRRIGSRIRRIMNGTHITVRPRTRTWPPSSREFCEPEPIRFALMKGDHAFALLFRMSLAGRQPDIITTRTRTAPEAQSIANRC
ncbi:hypothetical protein AcV5_005431 [Taiwanofungus camphoratus]|nr:hypothetical protein AcV5_005431 [Antrodia cinnamomea]